MKFNKKLNHKKIYQYGSHMKMRSHPIRYTNNRNCEKQPNRERMTDKWAARSHTLQQAARQDTRPGRYYGVVGLYVSSTRATIQDFCYKLLDVCAVLLSAWRYGRVSRDSEIISASAELWRGNRQWRQAGYYLPHPLLNSKCTDGEYVFLTYYIGSSFSSHIWYL